MSRIGKKPVPVPSGVNVALQGGVLTVKGPKGTLTKKVDPRVSVKAEGAEVQVLIPEAEARAMSATHGLVRALLANMVTGVTQGFERKLEIVGVGYKAEAKGESLTMNVGYSHPVEMPLPKGVAAKVERNVAITLSGIDREVLGQVAAEIRRVRPPEPYKGKGIRYAGEKIKLKEGKKGA